MTTAGSEEYVTDVPYMRAFVRDLSPVTLGLVAALNGFPPPRPEDFTTASSGAPTATPPPPSPPHIPRARFLGVRHQPGARRVRLSPRLGGGPRQRPLSGARLRRHGERRCSPPRLRRPPTASSAGSAPQSERRSSSSPSAKLKHGGLLYVSYNALPGWASVEPLRQLMLDRGAAVGGSSIERARQGLAFAKVLRDAGAAYFTGNPAASEMLETMEQTGLPYVVARVSPRALGADVLHPGRHRDGGARPLLRRPAPALSELPGPRDPRLPRGRLQGGDRPDHVREAEGLRDEPVFPARRLHQGQGPRDEAAATALPRLDAVRDAHRRRAALARRPAAPSHAPLRGPDLRRALPGARGRRTTWRS